jgi:hypothetical protein
MEREDMIAKLAALGFDQELLDSADDELVEDILRVWGDEQDGDEPPDATSERERTLFLERARRYRERADRAVRKYGGDDEHDLTRDEFERNRKGFEAMGCRSYAEAKAAMVPPVETGMRSGDEGHAGDDPRHGDQVTLEAAGGSGRAWSDARKERDRGGSGTGLSDVAGRMRTKPAERALVQMAEKFCEKNAKAFGLLGVSKAAFVRTYLLATPAQRRQLISA